MKKTEISNWNNYPRAEVGFEEPSFKEDISEFIANSENVTARGNGRCYGDASIGSNVVSSLKLNSLLEFDKLNGIIKVQAGIVLKDLIDFIMPEGWFLPVTPGTKFITIGGAIASNVHGKNHHKEGAFGKHVQAIDLILSNGKQITITRENNKEIFELTCGGMGLTGFIANATIRLKKIESSYIDVVSIKTRNLKETMDVFEQNIDSTYSMAWIDTLQKGRQVGRSIVMFGEHSDAKKKSSKEPRKFSIPFYFPNWVLNKLTIKLFNLVYYYKQLVKEKSAQISLNSFFYPLDSILNWNKMYGNKGFIQYQLVLPLDKSHKGLKEILNKVASSRFESFLSVLKLMGKEDNDISFPMEGYTLAMDMPIKEGIFDFLEDLDSIVYKYDGRLYLSKDARMNAEFFHKSHKAWKNFSMLTKTYDPKIKFISQLSSRLKLKSK